MIRAGSLTEQVLIQRRSPDLDAAGQQLNTWATVYTRRAELQQTPGSEVYVAAARAGRVPSIFKLRSGLEVTVADRVVCDDVVFNITSIVPEDEAVLLVCEELVGEAR